MEECKALRGNMRSHTKVCSCAHACDFFWPGHFARWRHCHRHCQICRKDRLLPKVWDDVPSTNAPHFSNKFAATIFDSRSPLELFCFFKWVVKVDNHDTKIGQIVASWWQLRSWLHTASWTTTSSNRFHRIWSSRFSSAFALAKDDGSVVTWGEPRLGGDSRAVQMQLRNVAWFAAPKTRKQLCV